MNGLITLFFIFASAVKLFIYCALGYLGFSVLAFYRFRVLAF